MTTGRSLRSRLVAGFAVVALTLLIVATAITLTTRSNLITQVDAQLTAAPPPAPDTPPEPRPDFGRRERQPNDLRERISSMYEGTLTPSGDLITYFEPNLPGQTFSLPVLGPELIDEADGAPFTTGAADGDTTYRVVAFPGSDRWFIRALPLSDVDSAMRRLIALQALGIGAVIAMLAAVAWWMIRLGIMPIEAITTAAATLGDEDLSERLPETRGSGTETRALARTLNSMLDRIASAVAEQQAAEGRLRRFVADASHELRTPVTTISGYADLYRRGALDGPEALDDAMRRTSEESDRMARLVEDMLTLAHFDQHRPVAADEVDLSQLLADVAADAAVAYPDREVVARIDSDLVVSGDSDRLRQAFSNVVRNAAVHNAAGTTITIRATSDGDFVVCEVADNGMGIAAADLARLTERFYRADRSRSRSNGGSGLGLSIAEAVIVAHHGSLKIDSDPGAGTTVQVTLPL